MTNSGQYGKAKKEVPSHLSFLLFLLFLQLVANSKAKMPLSPVMKVFRGNFPAFFPALVMALIMLPAIMLLAIPAQASTCHKSELVRGALEELGRGGRRAECDNDLNAPLLQPERQ